jgi:7-cyano-7-deazaguanine synthase
MKSALVVLSGGQDSTTCLYWVLSQAEIAQVDAVTFDYGQRHAKAEIAAAETIVRMATERFGKFIPHRVVELGDVFEGKSPLTTDAPLETYASIDEMDAIIQNRIELTFVPGRNAIFLGLAYSYAVARGLEAVVTGVSGADAANYPDCKDDFIRALEAAMWLATAQRVAIVTPLIDKTKDETVRLALGLTGCMDALAYSHTAYSGEYPPLTRDHASVLRAWGFEQAGVADPLIVRAWREGLMDLPKTANYNELR